MRTRLPKGIPLGWRSASRVSSRAAAVIEPLLGPRAYWLLVAAIIGLYLVMWLTHFGYVYGSLVEDRDVFSKGLATIRDWRSAFTVGCNCLHGYFYLVAYLPLALGLGLKSYPIPIVGDQIEQFRFFHLYSLLLHASLLGIWAVLALHLTRNRLVALLSLLLFATSPTIMLWSPQPDSRLLCLPFALIGIWLLLRIDWSVSPTRGWTLVQLGLAGLAFWLAQSIHYTAFYLIAPFALIYWGLWLLRGRRDAAVWRAMLCFGCGLVLPQVLLEAISYFAVGLPWDKGVTSTLFYYRVHHSSEEGSAGNAALWARLLWNQM